MMYPTMKNTVLTVLLFLVVTGNCFAGNAQRYGVARTATPVLNTPEFAEVFGGVRGGFPRLDACGNERALEFVALPGTVFRIEEEFARGLLTIFRVTSAEYPYPAKRGYFVDSRFVGITEKKPAERPRRLAAAATVIDNLLVAAGRSYVWGGNCRDGVAAIRSRYPLADSVAPNLETSALRQLRGVDCSGLLYEATGGFTPRNTSALISYGKAVNIAGLSMAQIIERVEPLDLIVWQGHVIIILDQERTIESRLDCGGSKGGVVVRPIGETLAGVMKGRMAANDLGDAGKRGKKGFVIRRWHAGYSAEPY